MTDANRYYVSSFILFLARLEMELEENPSMDAHFRMRTLA
jgi:hypothetical protein